ncbi:class I SAM-dependent methyltransferase [Paracoccus sp. SCSIO 75233]|uniref:class I SAM-dependent methyltransferase n=1 Tax=Paracoccus sp. SCSIO 75233 TaxID=3017782 RepID=UPI0022F01219|nr:methyltransferase [Paracoccus sp. SCSIO 75233]WBU52213.1 methyltransferase [Paracoccus sp. SCSIO 75233]
MRSARLELAFPDGVADRALVIGADGSEELPGFDRARTEIVEQHAHHFNALTARGWQVGFQARGEFRTILVSIPRSRDAARARIAEAAAHLAPDGALWIDGQKTDGIEAILKETKQFGGVSDVMSKAHGKIARINDPAAIPLDWAAAALTPAPGFTTRAGMFSADRIDPGSAALAAALPDRLPTRIVELGSGWGWLAAQILTHPGVETLHLVEADHAAHLCAQQNINDPRVHFHWADARSFRLPDPVNGVIMNPPFHEGRAADPKLGIAFIKAAASLLTGAGRLWMVANRHLPYEAALDQYFGEFSEIAGDNKFKILSATRARRGQSS